MTYTRWNQIRNNTFRRMGNAFRDYFDADHFLGQSGLGSGRGSGKSGKNQGQEEKTGLNVGRNPHGQMQ